MEPLLRSGAEFQYWAEVLKPESPDWKEGSSHKEQQSGKKLYALSKAVEWMEVRRGWGTTSNSSEGNQTTKLPTNLQNFVV